jgi:hypothetical protein
MARHFRVEARLNKDERDDLIALCLRLGLSRSTLMRNLINQAIDKQLERDELLMKVRGDYRY